MALSQSIGNNTVLYRPWEITRLTFPSACLLLASHRPWCTAQISAFFFQRLNPLGSSHLSWMCLLSLELGSIQMTLVQVSHLQRSTFQIRPHSQVLRAKKSPFSGHQPHKLMGAFPRTRQTLVLIAQLSSWQCVRPHRFLT